MIKRYIQRTDRNECNKYFDYESTQRKSIDVSSRQHLVYKKFNRYHNILTSEYFLFTIEYLIQVKTSPITIATERAVTHEHNDFFGFEYVGKEYEEAYMNTGNNFFN